MHFLEIIDDTDIEKMEDIENRNFQVRTNFQAVFSEKESVYLLELRSSHKLDRNSVGISANCILTQISFGLKLFPPRYENLLAFHRRYNTKIYRKSSTYTFAIKNDDVILSALPETVPVKILPFPVAASIILR